MTTPTSAKTPLLSAVDELPWYELINDSPEPPEDGLQEDDTITYVKAILWSRYEDDPNVLVVGRANIIYDSDTPGSVIVPDCCIVFGVDARTIKRDRRSYRIDEWGPPPDFVVEVASASTARRDLGEKRDIYARIGVREYWRLDRNGEYYGEPLVGERLVDGAYQRLALHTEPNGDVRVRSEVLGLDVYHRIEDDLGRFLFRDSVTGEWLNFLIEERAALQAEREALQAEREAHQAEREAHRAEQEARQAAEARASAAEAQTREIQAELDRLRSQQSGHASGG